MDLTVTCDRCKSVLEHVCKSDFRRAAIALYKTVLDGDFREALEASEYYERHAEEMPFFSETFLYALLGKDSARTVLGHVSSLIEAAGLNARELQQQAWIELIQSKVRLTYDEASDLLVLRRPGRIKDTKTKKGLSVLYGEPKVVLGLSIPKASTFDESLVPDVLWLRDAFGLWRQGAWGPTDFSVVG